MNQLILSLFPGIGLLDRAFEEAGFCVVRGPDLLWGGDIATFHPPANRFDGVIGGPPCQVFSQLRHMHAGTDHAQAVNLIPEFERVIAEAWPRWWLMENVAAAPEPWVDEYNSHSFLLNNRWVGGVQNRARRFTFAMWGQDDVYLDRYLDVVALEAVEYAPAVVASGGGRPNGKGIRDIVSRAAVQESLRLQGLPADFFTASPFTVEAQQKVLGNGVPLPLGRAIAQAVVRALASKVVPA